MRPGTFLPGFATRVAARHYVKLHDSRSYCILYLPRVAYDGQGLAPPSMGDGDECLHKFHAWSSEGHLAPGYDHQKPFHLGIGYGYDDQPLPVQRTSPNDLFLADAFAYNLRPDKSILF